MDKRELLWQRIKRARQLGDATDREIFDATFDCAQALFDGRPDSEIRSIIDRHILANSGPPLG